MTAPAQPPPLLLALDTSTATASLALYDGERVLAETTWEAGREHSTRLLVEVERALDRLDRRIGQVTGVVATQGPGSFTGVRVALSVAKGLAAGLGVPLWGASTLHVLAHAAHGAAQGLPVRPLLEAGRGRFATALYQDGVCVEPARGAAARDLPSLISQPTIVLGDLSATLRVQLAAHTPARVLPPAACLRRAGFLAELGWQAARAGAEGDPAALDAVYLAR